MSTLADIIMLAAAAGLIIGVLNITGISFAITLQMVALSGGVLAVLLVMTALLSLLLGLGMPTVGVYILLATLLAPALVELGVVPIAAHMYVLFFGMISMITPPVAIASFAAAAVASTDPWRTSFASLRIGAGLYLIPLAFVTQPALLLQGDAGSLAVALPRSLLAIALMTIAAIGHVQRAVSAPIRLVSIGLAVLHVLPLGTIFPEAAYWAASLAGLGLLFAHARPTPSSRRSTTQPSGRPG
jgi:TRAP-type uncharacterized transport system fused permease subunit